MPLIFFRRGTDFCLAIQKIRIRTKNDEEREKELALLSLPLPLSISYMATTSPTRSASSPPSSLLPAAAAAARQLHMPPTVGRTTTSMSQMQTPTPQLAESALLQGRFDAAASVGLSLLSGSRGPAASRGACVAVQALYELGR